VQTVYNELRLRNKFDKVKNDPELFLDTAEEAWETY
jgi:hypothetical protein